MRNRKGKSQQRIFRSVIFRRIKLILQSNTERNNLLYNFLIVLYPKNEKYAYTLFHSQN